MHLVNSQQLTWWIEDIFQASGIDESQAATIASHLVSANLRGVDSHGISKVEVYTKRLKHGIINKELLWKVTKETPVSAAIDGGNSMGIPLATKGMELAVQKAKESGIGIVGIRNSNHGGMMAAYTEYAASNDCIGLALTNAPPVMAPWGGKDAFFGTNPICYGIPTGPDNTNIVFDMATSTVAKGKIVLAEKEKRKIPIGWAITKDGKETTDPKKALDGLLLPVGGPKGYGLTFFVEVLSALFTGAAYGPFIGSLFEDFEKEQNTGQFLFAMRADLLEELNIFKNRMDEMITGIRNIELMEGTDRIYLPGEIEYTLAEKRKVNGIPISENVLKMLRDISEELGVDH
ncbi:Ldh family oxidoreductase [Virgibacillus sp. NKC19-16]|uniref:Ldh family oxidoreductase n=1 Tax=Virgibacillus salidurans TaxID=2831673 RepID=UPI001F3C615D|nr:Ldh family oxidoreductase [Virgibacillus sp. NKC19-16]UJL45557.1 Ldh family oxidoreductase [Virgibacillus sp. NKC19-16]